MGMAIEEELNCIKFLIYLKPNINGSEHCSIDYGSAEH